MNRRTRRLLAPLALTALVGAACGGGGTGTTAATTTTTVAEAAGTGPGSRAAVLRARLSGLLQEHSYLVGITTGTSLRGGDVAAASAALDLNSVDLSTAIGDLYGRPAADAFLPVWRRHIGFFVDYASGRAANDTARTDAAKAALGQYGGEFGTFLQSLNPNLTVEAVGELLAPHAQTTLAAIDAQASGAEDQFDKLREAAAHMPVMAATLTGAIQKQQVEQVTGAVDSTGATLRSELVDVLQEHVYLAGIATGAALSDGPAEQASEALGANSEGLANLVTALYGDEAGGRFLESWRSHVTLFADYARARGADDTAGASRVRSELDAYPAAFARFLASANPELDARKVERHLSQHIASIVAVIDRQAAGDPGQFVALREAAQHMPAFAATLADALAAQFPERFAS